MGVPRDPDARRYHRVALQRLEQAELIRDKVGLPAASVYLAGYAVECALKALLIERTADVDRPDPLTLMKRSFGHDIRRLRAGILGRGGTVPGDVARELAFVSSWLPELRYESGPGGVRAAARLLGAASAVLRWVDRSI